MSPCSIVRRFAAIVHTVFTRNVCEDRGTVTAEFAVVFPVVVAVIAMVLSLTQVVIVQLDCQDAARQAAIAAVQLDQSGQPPRAVEDAAAKTARTVSHRIKDIRFSWDKDSFEIVTQCSVLGNAQIFSAVNISGSARGIRK